ncbi:fimbrial biogenesis chaperone [Pseudocitrobacter corydidari]
MLRHRLHCFTLWLLAGLSISASAATLQVAPVLITLKPGEQAAALYLSNTGHEPIQAQVRVAAWTQVNGKDTLTATTDVASSPAMTRIAPGNRQLVRVVMLNPQTDNRQHSYRLLIDELPDLQVAHADENAVHFLLRYSIPVFIAGEEGASRVPLTCAWDARRRVLSFANPGQQYARLSDIAILSASGTPIADIRGLAGYVLAGSRVDIPVNYRGNTPPTTLNLHLNSHNDDCVLSSGISVSAAAMSSSASSNRG